MNSASGTDTQIPMTPISGGSTNTKIIASTHPLERQRNNESCGFTVD